MGDFNKNNAKCKRNTTGAEQERMINKGNNKITELRTILQRESPNS
jgi:hypothetical protein